LTKYGVDFNSGDRNVFGEQRRCNSKSNQEEFSAFFSGYPRSAYLVLLVLVGVRKCAKYTHLDQSSSRYIHVYLQKVNNKKIVIK
jgi:hypothetical protein